MRKRGLWLASGVYGGTIVATAVISGKYFVLGWLALPVAGFGLLAAEDVLRVLLRRSNEDDRARPSRYSASDADPRPPAANDRINYPM